MQGALISDMFSDGGWWEEGGHARSYLWHNAAWRKHVRRASVSTHSAYPGNRSGTQLESFFLGKPFFFLLCCSESALLQMSECFLGMVPLLSNSAAVQYINTVF